MKFRAEQSGKCSPVNSNALFTRHSNSQIRTNTEDGEKAMAVMMCTQKAVFVPTKSSSNANQPAKFQCSRECEKNVQVENDTGKTHFEWRM